ncbi:uncharacterized protein LOC110975805 [Acanthaster planci]|uniref:Uncharacterized protein LOC110975805 n=1 Tax=Acanthaster planci TaxID=133434 RepID=A0A8B7XTV8_ACAPL|nr:uncharacterized protein LOC110975805 [Acanthaster planci]
MENMQLALTYCAKAVTCQDGQKQADYHRLRGDCLCAMGEHQAALVCHKRALECEIGVNHYKRSGHSLVIEFAHILEHKQSLAQDFNFLSDMLYWLLEVANICLSLKWTLWSLQKVKDLPGIWESFVQFCNDNGYNSELETIQLAVTDQRSRPTQLHPRRMYSVPTAEGRSSPVISKRQHCYSETKSYELEEAAFEPQTTRLKRDTQKRNDEETFQTAEEAGDSATALPGESPKTFEEHIPAKLDKDVQTGAELLSQLDLSPAPDTIQVTYSVNLKTGHTQHVSTTPSSQELSTEDVSKKYVRVAPETPLYHLELRYDFFVIYGKSASEWVKHRLLEELEGVGFKGCIKDRDFILGKPKLENYSESIKNSVCTIIVITKDFETNNHDVMAMHMALEDRLVIPVLREDRDMPPALKPIEYLDATGAVDWAKLERSIEQQVKLDVAWEG